jgi:AbiV family abortive infection protein
MHERRIRRLLELKRNQRFPVVGEGLARVGEHVAGLARSISTLKNAGDLKGAAALDIICTEEASKILILLDLCRCMHKPNAEFEKGCKYFYDHLARSIYAYVHEANPSRYSEVVGYVKDNRPSHYLDGPNDADWIFRNDLMRQRENTLYVDYEEVEPGKYEWTGPDPDLIYVPQRITKLVLSMQTAGMLTEAGARVVSEVWKNSSFDENTRWEYCSERNLAVLNTLSTSKKEVTRELVAARHVIREKWTFPLTQLDLFLDRSTTIEEFQEQQNRHYNRTMIDEYGEY